MVTYRSLSIETDSPANLCPYPTEKVHTVAAGGEIAFDLDIPLPPARSASQSKRVICRSGDSPSIARWISPMSMG